MISYPEQHLNFLKYRFSAIKDEYGTLSKSETKFNYYTLLVQYLIEDKYSSKRRIQGSFRPFFKRKDELSYSLYTLVGRAVDILFTLKTSDAYLVEKSYMILDELTRRAKDEGISEINDYLKNNPQVLENVSEKNDFIIGPNGWYTNIDKKQLYDLDAIYSVPSVIGTLPLLNSLFNQKYDYVVSYLSKYRKECYDFYEENQLMESLDE